MGLQDEYTLLQVKQKLGGSVKKRSGSKSIRYRLHHKTGMLLLISLINGHIRNSIRTIQLKSVCQSLELTYKKPKLLTYFNG